MCHRMSVASLQTSFGWEGKQMELFAGFNVDELAMMEELLRLLVEDDDVLIQHQSPHTSARPDSQALFGGLPGAPPKADPMRVHHYGDYYSRDIDVPNDTAWDAQPAMVAPRPPFDSKASRARTRSNFASDDEPMHKRGRVDVAPTMRTSINCLPDYPYYC
ncbi:hypothetical protein PsorP6_010728 [Peronosclerospora sorghi]|uniref:Uncharacterized protein n=1 Tax=Peronosclerospora sorghi TaxID=230839 RepID=A0ACC0VVB1_9STRA|nr:hypothetical protein PsorP6_010728 [Peronosclerospora sorghi]